MNPYSLPGMAKGVRIRFTATKDFILSVKVSSNPTYREYFTLTNTVTGDYPQQGPWNVQAGQTYDVCIGSWDPEPVRGNSYGTEYFTLYADGVAFYTTTKAYDYDLIWK